MLGSSLIDNFLFSMNGPHVGYHVLQRFTKETLESLPILSLRKGRTRNVPDSTNHSLYLIKMLSSNREGKRWISLFFFFAQSLNAPLLPVSIFSSYEARKNTVQTICSATFAPFTPHHTTPHHATPNHARHTTWHHTTKKTKTHTTHTHMYVYMYLYMYLYMYVYVYVYMYVCMYVYIHLTKKRTFHDVYCSKPLTFHNG